jgi:hypothetical protein
MDVTVERDERQVEQRSIEQVIPHVELYLAMNR